MTSILIAFTTFIIGSLLHFTHALPHDSKKKNLLDILSATNESTWEHMKILIVGGFLSLFIVPVYYDFFTGNVLMGGAFAIVVAAALLPAIYYTYKKYLKKNILAVDIGLFLFVSILFGILTMIFRNMLYRVGIRPTLIIGLLPWLVIWVVIIWWTYKPPDHIIFRCPVTKKLGHTH